MDAQKLKPVRSLLLIADVSAYRMARSPVTVAVLPSLEANLARAHAHTYTHIHFLALCMNLFFHFYCYPAYVCLFVCECVVDDASNHRPNTISADTYFARLYRATGVAKVQRHRVMKRAFVTRKNVTPGFDVDE